MSQEIFPDDSFIEKNYNKLLDYCNNIEGEDSSLSKMIQQFGDRLALAPATTQKDYYSCFPGGLCFHILTIMVNVGKLSSTFCKNDFSKSSLLRVSILSQIGKVGSLSEPYFVPTNEQWKISKGQYYDYNQSISFMRPTHRSLYLAQQFNISLTEDEYVAILLSEDVRDDQSALYYKHREPKLALLLQQAIKWSEVEERTNKVDYP